MASVAVTVADGLELLDQLLQAAAAISPVIKAAQAAGQTILPAQDWGTIQAQVTADESALQQAIAAAKAKGQ